MERALAALAQLRGVIGAVRVVRRVNESPSGLDDADRAGIHSAFGAIELELQELCAARDKVAKELEESNRRADELKDQIGLMDGNFEVILEERDLISFELKRVRNYVRQWLAKVSSPGLVPVATVLNPILEECSDAARVALGEDEFETFVSEVEHDAVVEA